MASPTGVGFWFGVFILIAFMMFIFGPILVWANRIHSGLGWLVVIIFPLVMAAYFSVTNKPDTEGSKDPNRRLK